MNGLDMKFRGAPEGIFERVGDIEILHPTIFGLFEQFRDGIKEARERVERLEARAQKTGGGLNFSSALKEGESIGDVLEKFGVKNNAAEAEQARKAFKAALDRDDADTMSELLNSSQQLYRSAYIEILERLKGEKDDWRKHESNKPFVMSAEHVFILLGREVLHNERKRLVGVVRAKRMQRQLAEQANRIEELEKGNQSTADLHAGISAQLLECAQ